MTAQGLVDVDNPSEVFIRDSLVSEGQEGAAAAVVMEGSRYVRCRSISRSYYFVLLLPHILL